MPAPERDDGLEHAGDEVDHGVQGELLLFSVRRAAHALHDGGRQLLILLAHNSRTSFHVSKVALLGDSCGFA